MDLHGGNRKSKEGGGNSTHVFIHTNTAEHKTGADNQMMKKCYTPHITQQKQRREKVGSFKNSDGLWNGHKRRPNLAK